MKVTRFVLLLVLFLVNSSLRLESSEIREIIRRAEKGSVKEQFFLGRAYQYGTSGLKKDYHEAALWYEKAAKQNHSTAAVEMARYHASDSGSHDCQKILFWFNKSFDYANAETFSMIGHIFFFGLGNCIPTDTNKAIVFLNEAIKNEDYVHAYYLLGYFHSFCKHSLTDTIKGIEYLRKSVQLGSIKSIHLLGLLYEQGLHVQKDITKAQELFEYASRKNHIPSILRLGYINLQTDTTKEKLKALYWYSKAAELGNAEGFLTLSYYWEQGIGVQKDTVRAFSLCLEAAKKGLANAMYRIGTFYQKGYYVEKDIFQAVMWYRKAMQAQHKKAAMELGWILYRDENEDVKDIKEAVSCFEKAGIHGFSGLATMYYYGDLVEKNVWKAIKLFTDAVAIDNGYSAFMLGHIYYSEDGFRSDELAFYWNNKSAEQGYAEGINNLANLYEKGYGVDTDYQKAIELYMEAAKLGSSTAELSLGLLYLNGRGVLMDTTKAYEFFLHSAEKSNTEGIFELGKFLIERRAKKKSIDEGVQCVLKSAKGKNSEAMFYCSVIYNEGIYIKSDIVEAIAWLLLSKKYIQRTDAHIRETELKKINDMLSKIQKNVVEDVFVKGKNRSAEIELSFTE